MKILETIRDGLSSLADQLTETFRMQGWFLVIVVIAAALRLYQLETHLIFFPDAGRDFLAAYTMTETGKIPLLGIPSSIPRFKQGPLMVWLIGVLQIFGGTSPVAVGYLMVMFSLFTMCLLYWLLREHVSPKSALIASVLFALSPLAIAQSRMPYHISPIPVLTMLFLMAVVRMKRTWRSVLLAGLSWAVLFQFELCLAPLFLIVLWKIYTLQNKSAGQQSRKRTEKRKPNLQQFALLSSIAGTGAAIGLAPQILYDITHGFQQLGLFLGWSVYRTGSVVAGSEHRFSLTRFSHTLDQFALYWTRVWSVDQPLLLLIGFIMLLVSLALIVRQWGKTPDFIRVTAASFALLCLAYVVHGSPSEAYFPPFLVFLPILIAYGVAQLPVPKNALIIAGTAYGLFTVVSLQRANWFVQPTAAGFQYGPSYAQQQMIVQLILDQTGDHPYRLISTDEGSHFATHLDTYRYLLLLHGSQESSTADAKTIVINHHGSDLQNYPNGQVYHFESMEVIFLPDRLWELK